MHPLFQTKSNYAVGGQVEEQEMPGQDDDLSQAAQELISAIQSGDPHQVAEAFESMFQMCESQPHEEMGHAPDQEQE